MKLNIRNRKNVIASLAKQSMTFVALVWVLLSLVFFVACSDFGDRNNPLDPGAGNYVAQNDDSKSSSSSVILSSSEESSTSRSSSSIEEQKFSSSSKIFEPAKGPSSSNKNNASSSSMPPDWGIGSSSSSVKTQSSSSNNKASSSSKNKEQSSNNKIPESAERSSSSVKSDSVPASSSSSVTQPPQSSNDESSWTCGVSTITRGDYEYKTVVIKEQCWTKENLHYVPSTGNTMCYGNEASNCDRYGRLYDYEAAEIACPTGWRLPTSAEYEALAEYSMEGATLYDAGAHFKSTSGWNPENGDDFLEFTALPGGKCNEEQSCQNLGMMGYWWTSTEKVKNTSHLVLALNGDGDSYSATNKMDNDQYISVRCVKK